MEGGIVLRELGPDEGVEVIAPEPGLRPLGEVLLRGREGIVPPALPVHVQHLVIGTTLEGRLVCSSDTLLIETQDLVVIGVRELVQDHSGLDPVEVPIGEGGGPRNMDALGE